ncbi:MAG: DUF1818 family protein [Oscillatoriales cyanobacterium C42_A2020_001]|nr:DUF1818 family protein [Leptolyngbyaceae cyanobacterium C42_A2020_001]
MERLIKSGRGWRIGWNPTVAQFKGLVGTDDWSLELTEAEFNDFCRLLSQLVDAIATMQAELMNEEAIAIEVESDLLWLEAEGYSHAYSLHLILLTGRRGEGSWQADAVPQLWQAVQTIRVF